MVIPSSDKTEFLENHEDLWKTWGLMVIPSSDKTEFLENHEDLWKTWGLMKNMRT